MEAHLIPELCAGSDLSVVNAAKRSFRRSAKELDEAGIRLIKFLAREGHTTPFRHPQLSFECEAPIYVARQLAKHQVGMSWSEVSRRYVIGGIEFYQPDAYRHDVEDRKQGTGPDVDGLVDTRVRAMVSEHIKQCATLYNHLVKVEHVAPEQARGVLPQAMTVLWTWTGSLLSWAHLYRLRHHKDAQKETREFANLIGQQAGRRFPYSWEALTNE